MAEGDGWGQLDPSDTASEFNKQVFIIQQQLAKLSTIKVVLVKAVDTDAKTVDVQPMVNLLDGLGQSSPHGTILGIPYWQWQFGANAILADPAVGDIGVMACADRDISSVKATKAIANPGSDRQMDASDGIYFGGILNGDPTQSIKFTDAGMELHDKNANSLVSSAAGWAFTGPVTFNEVVTMEAALQLAATIEGVGGGVYAGDIHTSGTITGDTGVVSGAIHLTTHRHTGVATGGGDTGGPTP